MLITLPKYINQLLEVLVLILHADHFAVYANNYNIHLRLAFLRLFL